MDAPSWRRPSDIQLQSGVVWNSETRAKLEAGMGTQRRYSKAQSGGDHQAVNAGREETP